MRLDLGNIQDVDVVLRCVALEHYLNDKAPRRKVAGVDSVAQVAYRKVEIYPTHF